MLAPTWYPLGALVKPTRPKSGNRADSVGVRCKYSGVSFLTRGIELKASADAASRILTAPPAPKYTVGAGDVSGLISGAYGLDTALQVPAYSRGVSLIASIVAGMPLQSIDPATGTQLPPQGLLSSPTISPGVPNVTLMRETATEMVAYGIAYWQVTAVDGNDWPTAVKFRAHEHVATNADGTRYTVDGVEAPVKGAGRIIAFDTGEPGSLESGWLAIRTALSLENAANNYATSPLPSLALQSTGLDLDTDEARELVAQWDLASARSATRYLNSQVDVQTFGWTAAELQLVEARQHAAVEIGRILNLDPYWLGAQPGGSSVTYSNEQDRRAALLDFTVMPVARVIEQRLSMADVTGSQRIVRFTTMSFLRANLAERVAALVAYVTAGIMTIDEARAIEPLVAIGDSPE